MALITRYGGRLCQGLEGACFLTEIGRELGRMRGPYLICPGSGGTSGLQKGGPVCNLDPGGVDRQCIGKASSFARRKGAHQFSYFWAVLAECGQAGTVFWGVY